MAYACGLSLLVAGLAHAQPPPELSDLSFEAVPPPQASPDTEPTDPPVDEPPFPAPSDPYGGEYHLAPGMCDISAPTEELEVIAYGEARCLADPESDLEASVAEAAGWRDASVAAWVERDFQMIDSGDEQRVGDERTWWAYLQALPAHDDEGWLIRTVELGVFSSGLYYRRLREVRTIDPSLAELARECEEALAHPEWTMAHKEWALRQLREDEGAERVDGLLRALRHVPAPTTMLYRIHSPALGDFGPDPLETGPESEEMRAALEAIITDLCRQYGVSAASISAGICDPATNEFALWNGDTMRYSACVAKLLIILTVFEEEAEGRLQVDAGTRLKLAKMIRASAMPEAGEMARRVGLQRIREVAESEKYRLYVPGVGGLWHGRLFWGHSGSTYRDPVAHLSHGVTARQALRFYWLMDHGRLVSPEASHRMKMIFLDNRVGIIYHKCVKGLWSRGVTMVRKSGTYSSYHNDTLMVTGPGRHYIVVGLVTSYNGDAFLQAFAKRVDDYFIERGMGNSGGAGGRGPAR